MYNRAIMIRTQARDSGIERYAEQFADSIDELNRVSGMYLLVAQMLPTDPEVDFHTWVDERKGQGEISLVENRHLGVLYAQLSLASEALCDTATETIAKHVPIMSVAELQAAAEAANATDGAALAALGLASPPEPDETTARLVTAGLASPRPEVREGAINAAFLLKWPVFQQPIADALAREDRDDLRRILEAAATVCDPAWPGFDADALETDGD